MSRGSTNVIILFMLAVVRLSAAQPGPLQVGWASVDLTPEMSADRQAIVAGLLIPRYTSQVVSRIGATALALERVGTDGTKEQAVLVSCDMTGMVFLYDDRPSPLQQVRERLRSRLPDLDMSKVFLMATHAHSTPLYDENMYLTKSEGVIRPAEYLEFLLDRITSVVEAAWRARSPGSMSWGLGHAVVGYNRRVVYPDGRAVMGGWRKDPNFDRIEGVDDHGVELLFFWSGARKLSGVLINVACPSQADSQALYISADFWDGVRKNLRHHPDFKEAAILPQLAAAGDQWAFPNLRDKAEAIMRTRRGLTLTEELGRRIAAAVIDVYPHARNEVEAGVPFRHVVSRFTLPYRVITPGEAAEARKEYARLEASPNDPFRHNQMQNLGAVLERHRRQLAGPVTIGVEVHVLRLGDVAIATNPFELFIDYGLQIKALSPALLTLTSQLSADVGRFAGYLATDRAVAGGGYSAEARWFNYVGPEGGHLLVNRTVALIAELWREKP